MNHTFYSPNIKNYPQDLDDVERDQIKAAELRAARVIALKQGLVRSKAERETLLLRDWVLPIFVAFSNLAFNRAKEGRWPIHKADFESREFLSALAAWAGMNSPDAWMAGGGPIIRAEIQSEIERSPEWQRHQEKLLELVDAPDNAVVATIADIGALNSIEPNSSEALRRAGEASTRQPKPQLPDTALMAATPSEEIAEGAMADLPVLPKTAQTHIQQMTEMARNEVDCALTSMANAAAERGPSRDQPLEDARAHVRRATDLLFGAYAQEYLQANRLHFSRLLPAICREVELDISCPGFEAIVSETMHELKDKWSYRMSIETAVSNPGLWRDLSDEFAILAKEEREIQGIRGRLRLFATGAYKPGDSDIGYWYLTNGPRDGFRVRFDAVATRAGMALASRGMKPRNYRDYWLHCLSLYLSTKDSPLLTPGEDCEHNKTYMLHKLPEVSSAFASRLEECALENEQFEKTSSIAEAPTRLTKTNEGRNEALADVSSPVEVSALMGEEPTSARSAIRSNFSQRDQKLHDELIRLKGGECFRQHKDALLIREHLRNARAFLKDTTMTPPAMRACLRRIRQYYNYPLSRQITTRS